MSDIRARNQISDSNKHFVKTTALLHPRTFPFPEAVKKCLKCGTEPSEPQCGTDRKEYENSCYRECATPPSLGAKSFYTNFILETKTMRTAISYD